MKNRTLYLLIWLTAIWSWFYGIYKYYLRGILQWNLNNSLEQISGFLSFWAIASYFIGWALYHVFKEKVVLIICSLAAAVLMWLWLWQWFSTHLLIWIIAVLTWFFYGLWTVIKNILISIEIEKTWYNDTFINWLATIAFVVFIIIWSILWGLLAEKFWYNGSWYIILIMLWSIILVAWLNYKHEKVTLTAQENINKIKEYVRVCIPNFGYIIKEYWLIMLLSALLLVIATILSQKAIEFSVNHLGKKGSEASILLLYSAVGTIIGNAITMKVTKKRWPFFIVFTYWFSVLSFIFPFFLSNFFYISILATFAGIFFWINYNLIESYFLSKIWEDNKRDYGSATYGMITSITITVMMFLIDYLQHIIWFNWVFYVMWIIILLIWMIINSIYKKL